MLNFGVIWLTERRGAECAEKMQNPLRPSRLCGACFLYHLQVAHSLYGVRSQLGAELWVATALPSPALYEVGLH